MKTNWKRRIWQTLANVACENGVERAILRKRRTDTPSRTLNDPSHHRAVKTKKGDQGWSSCYESVGAAKADVSPAAQNDRTAVAANSHALNNLPDYLRKGYQKL